MQLTSARSASGCARRSATSASTPRTARRRRLLSLAIGIQHARAAAKVRCWSEWNRRGCQGVAGTPRRRRVNIPLRTCVQTARRDGRRHLCPCATSADRRPRRRKGSRPRPRGRPAPRARQRRRAEAKEAPRQGGARARRRTAECEVSGAGYLSRIIRQRPGPKSSSSSTRMVLDLCSATPSSTTPPATTYGSGGAVRR